MIPLLQQLLLVLTGISAAIYLFMVPVASAVVPISNLLPTPYSVPDVNGGARGSMEARPAPRWPRNDRMLWWLFTHHTNFPPRHCEASLPISSRQGAPESGINKTKASSLYSAAQPLDVWTERAVGWVGSERIRASRPLFIYIYLPCAVYAIAVLT